MKNQLSFFGSTIPEYKHGMQYQSSIEWHGMSLKAITVCVRVFSFVNINLGEMEAPKKERHPQLTKANET